MTLFRWNRFECKNIFEFLRGKYGATYHSNDVYIKVENGYDKLHVLAKLANKIGDSAYEVNTK